MRVAALRLLCHDGPGGVTVERWQRHQRARKRRPIGDTPTERLCCGPALTAVTGDPGEPPDTDPRQRIRWALEQTWHQIAEVLGPAGLAAVIGGTDEGFTDHFRSVVAPYTDALEAPIRDDIAAGKLRRDLDAQASVSLFVSA